MRDLQPAIFWGGTGHAVVLNDFLAEAGYRLVALFDNDPAVVSPLEGIPLYHGRAGFDRWRAAHAVAGLHVAVAIGGARGCTRRTIGDDLVAAGLTPLTLVHPRAVVCASAPMGEGCHVLAGAVLCAGAVFGRWCILNTAASVDHECRLGDGVHIGPGATVAGRVEIENDVFVGAGAVVLPRLRIGQGAIVGAGAVVTHDVPAGTIVAGNPAHYMRDVETDER